MDFLSICRRLKREARVSGATNTPASVTGQSGEMLNLVEWVQSAYQDIQNDQPEWEFLRADFSFQTVSGASSYSPVAAGLTELLKWRVRDEYSIRCYLNCVNNEQPIIPISWEEMRSRYFGSNRTQTGRPVECAVKPDNSLIFWPVPNGIYTVVGEYYKQPQTLTANTDIPIFPGAYHMALVWLALRYTAAYQAAPEKYAHSDNEYSRLLNALRHDQLAIELSV